MQYCIVAHFKFVFELPMDNTLAYHGGYYVFVRRLLLCEVNQPSAKPELDAAAHSPQFQTVKLPSRTTLYAEHL